MFDPTALVAGFFGLLGGGGIGAAWIKRSVDLNAQHINANDLLLKNLMTQVTALSAQVQTAQMETKGFERDWVESEKKCMEKIDTLKREHDAAIVALREQMEKKIASMEEGFRQEQHARFQVEAELRSVAFDRDNLKIVNDNLHKRNGELMAEVEGLKRGRRKEDLN